MAQSTPLPRFNTIKRYLPKIGPVDLILASGDLTDTATPEEYAYFRELTASLDIPFAIIPGNHDRRDAMRTAFSDLSCMPDSGPLNWHIELTDMHVVGLDSLVEGAPHGELSDMTLVWLDSILPTIEGKPLLISIHHPPFETKISFMDRINLVNADALFVRFKRCPVQVTATCGHVHRMITTVRNGGPVLIAPSPAHSLTLDHDPVPKLGVTDEPGGFLLHHYVHDGSYHGIVSDFPVTPVA